MDRARAMRRVLCLLLMSSAVTGCSLSNLLEPPPPPPTEVSAQGLILPVRSGQVTSSFGMRRLGGVTRMHKGVDFVGTRGRTPVFAVADGFVERSESNESYGNWIQIRHAGARHSRYAHLFRRDVDAGDRVQRGDLIGRVGSTGRVTGAHLHFEMRVQGAPVDPLAYLPPIRIVGGRSMIRDPAPSPTPPSRSGSDEVVPEQAIVAPPSAPMAPSPTEVWK